MLRTSATMTARPGQNAKMGQAARALGQASMNASNRPVNVWMGVGGTPFGTYSLTSINDSVADWVQIQMKAASSPEIAAASELVAASTSRPLDMRHSKIFAVGGDIGDSTKPVAVTSRGIASPGTLVESTALLSSICDTLYGQFDIACAAAWSNSGQMGGGIVISWYDSWEQADEMQQALFSSADFLDLTIELNKLTMAGTLHRTLWQRLA